MTFAPCVVDASVVVRWVYGDPALAVTMTARKLLDDWKAGAWQFHAPDLLMLEVASALWKGVRFAGLPAEAALAGMRGLSSFDLQLHRLAPLATASLDVALLRGCTPYDGSYLALAGALGAPLFTADRALASRGAGLDVRLLG